VTQYLIRRLLYCVPVILIVSVTVFGITMLLPGDPAMAYLGPDAFGFDEKAYQELRVELGLNDPLPVQYANWLSKAVRGDFGTSIRTKYPVQAEIAARLPITLHLSIMAMIIAMVIAIPVGVISAKRPGSMLDNIGTVVAISGVAIPSFWLGILLIYVFGMWLRILPTSGYVHLDAGLWPSIQSLILPSFALGTSLSATIMRQTRSALIEVLQQDYITVARSKGVSENRLVRIHALKNALIPVITVLGLQGARLIGGTVIIETIFALPGIGRLMVDAIFYRDFPILQGTMVVIALVVVATSFLTDVLYAYIDPRIRYA
jgi:peptide/nickel transport system permease protein